MKHKKSKKKAGRPPKMTPDVLQKLEDAFSNALPDEEACLYAGIAPRTLYYHQEKNPLFLQRKEALKLTPNIAARKAIVAALGDVKVAQWWLEKRDPEMRPTSKVEHSGKVTIEQAPTDPAVIAALKTYEETRQKQIREEARSMP